MAHTLVPASYLIFEKESKILLLRRFQTGYCDGMYSLVAGHVDPGETFTEAAIREAKEEVGIALTAALLSVMHVLQRDSQQEINGERMDVFFKVNDWEGALVNNEPGKCDQLLWCDIQDLPENVIPYIKDVLFKIASGVLYSEYGWKRG